MNIKDFYTLLKNEDFPLAISALKEVGIVLWEDTRLILKENNALTNHEKESLASLIRNTLFEDDLTPDEILLSYINKVYFKNDQLINFLVIRGSEIHACSQIESLNRETIYFLSTAISGGNGTQPSQRGKGIYRIFMLAKYLYAIAARHNYIIAKTRNPFSLEQYYKHGMLFNPNLYFSLENHAENCISLKKSKELIVIAQMICKKNFGWIIDAELMEENNGFKYTFKKQACNNNLINDFCSRNAFNSKNNNYKRFLAIIEKDDILKHFYDNLSVLHEKALFN